MKILKYILALMLMLPFLASCDDDEVGNPNVSPQDFVTVSNRTARVSLDDASGMYVLDEYVKADTLNYETCIFMVDRKVESGQSKSLRECNRCRFWRYRHENGLPSCRCNNQ